MLVILLVEKNGDVIVEILHKAIEDIGPSNVIQVVTDNANCYWKRDSKGTQSYILVSLCGAHPQFSH